MEIKDKLYSILNDIDNRGYKSYKKIENNWYDFVDYQLGIPYVQGDPFAKPSKVFIKIRQEIAKFPDTFLEKEIRKIALEDYLTRQVVKNIKYYTQGKRGSGKSGLITISKPGQEVLARTSVEVTENWVIARLRVGLPAKGRTVLGYQAQDMFFKEFPQIVNNSLFYENLNEENLRNHIQIVEEQEYIRNRLKERNLVSFIANNSILPRESGINDKPLQEKETVPFTSPEEYEVKFKLPYSGSVKGMGIKKGITLIVGGGYHGKSTLLNAVEKGVYNHIPGDGREYVVTRRDGVKIRAEDGRGIEKVDITPFIKDLPQGRETKKFSTGNASGSTSQAASIIEALEIGTRLLLIDEDTSATNFMIRDARMQRLVAREKEPITPFIDKVKYLFQEYDVSTVMVIGGAGDYFDVADHVILMDEYRPKGVTSKAQQIANKFPSERIVEGNKDFGLICKRIPVKDSIDPYHGLKVKVKTRDRNKLQFGREDIDLSNLEQIVDRGQTQAIGDLLVYGLKKDYIDGKSTLKEVLDKLYQDLNENGLKIISPFKQPEGSYVMPRPFEVAATLNRLRSLKIKDMKY